MSTKRVGLTGGIGSGKSSVAAMFAALGVAVLDLDQVGRSVVAPGSKGLDQLCDAFGDSILDANGSLNRAALAQHCFAHAGETDKLNAILHPLIRQAEDAWLKQQNSCYAIIEASVLLESGGETRMDALIVVLANTELRRQRVLSRGDRNSAQFDAIVARQCNDDERRESADIVFINESSFKELQLNVIDAHEVFLKQFKD